MPTFNVRTHEELILVTADEMVVADESDRVTFMNGGKVTAVFSRYLWVQEQSLETVPATTDSASE